MIVLGFPYGEPMTVKYYNYTTIYIARNPIFHKRIKHVGVDYDFARVATTSKNIYTIFSTLENELADIFTKPLGVNCFFLLYVTS